jgi:hypothetical protein
LSTLLLSDAPPVSLDDAISKPIYSLQEISSDDEELSDSEVVPEAGKEDGAASKPKKRLQACILCPQRLFKNDKMVEDHVKSKVSPSPFYSRTSGIVRWI